MLVRRNMDDLFDLDLAGDQIAATYVCACNPRKFKHYPGDWYVKHTFMLHVLSTQVETTGHPRTVHTLPMPRSTPHQTKRSPMRLVHIGYLTLEQLFSLLRWNRPISSSSLSHPAPSSRVTFSRIRTYFRNSMKGSGYLSHGNITRLECFELSTQTYGTMKKCGASITSSLINHGCPGKIRM